MKCLNRPTKPQTQPYFISTGAELEKAHDPSRNKFSCLWTEK